VKDPGSFLNNMCGCLCVCMRVCDPLGGLRYVFSVGVSGAILATVEFSQLSGSMGSSYSAYQTHHQPRA
jgi:hypothetical protein